MLGLAVATRQETYERIRDPLASRGIRVEHVRVTERAVALSDPPWDPDAVDAGFVYPSRLMEGAVAATALGVPWMNGRADVLASRNKAGALSTLAAADVPVPETVLVSNPVDAEDVVAAARERLNFPLVVKPNSTTRGAGVAKVHDPDSLDGVTDYLDLVHDYRATGDRSYLLQEFLPDATDYRVMCLDGEYAGAVRRERADGWKHNVHRGATAERVDLDPELRTLAERAARALDVPLLGVDLLVTDDRALVNETNARPTVDDEAKYVPDFYDSLAALIRRTADSSPGE